MGTRATAGRKLRRTAVAVAVCIAAVLVLAPAPARAGRYSVVQCDRSNRAYPDAIFERQFAGDYAFAFRCEEDEDANALQIHSLTGAPANRFGRISWAAPPGASLVGVNVEARMRNDMGHQARLSWLDAAGNEAGRIATGSDEPGGFATFDRQLTDGGRARFAASLNCVRADGCRFSDQARNWIRSVRLTVEDRAAPGVAVSGALTSAGWHRGVQPFDVAAFDFGSGLRAVDVRVNGSQVAPSLTLPCATIAGTAVASRMQPCEPWRALPGSIDTRSAPIVDGDNQIVVCAADFGSSPNLSCARSSFRVDNAPPELAFAAQQDPEDPELIRASAIDRHSGLASASIAYRPLGGGAWRELPTQAAAGAVQARVDSSAEPPGLYVFRVSATDVAGNAAATSARAGGGEMVLRFPIREATGLDASLEGAQRSRAAYGHRPSLRATLTAASGRPLEGQALDVVETFAPGSSLAPVARTVRTDSSGRIDVQLTRGPSRGVAVSYAGSRRYLPAVAHPLGLTIEGDARLRAMPRHVTAGRKVLFRGSVGTYGAAMPDGKLVELQVKGGGIRRYRTVRQAFRTDPRGRWSLRYGFGRFYRRPTKFRFRLKVAREDGWPYLAPTVSRARQLTVEPKRKQTGKGNGGRARQAP